MKLLLTSDWHETPFAKRKFETQKVSWGEKIIQFLGGSGKSRVMEKMAEVLKDLEISTVIHNGDLQENSKNEQGIVSDEDLASARSIIDLFEEKNRVRILLNAGNHELGYHKTSQPLATDPDGGISLASIVKFMKLMNLSDIYHSFRLGGYRIIFIPYLITEEVGKRFDIELEKREILNGLMHDLHRGEKVILFVHDPDSLMNKRLTNLIRDYKKGISLIFCGHYHAQATLSIVKWLIRIFNWKTLIPIRWTLRFLLTIVFDADISKAVQKSYRQRSMVPQLMEEFNVRIIPAPGGMLGFGGGFLTLDLDTLEVTKY